MFSGDYFNEVLDYVDARNEYPVVLKADGLAGGKEYLFENREEFLAGLEELREGTLQTAAQTLVLEEFMPGEEAFSLHCAMENTLKLWEPHRIISGN